MVKARKRKSKRGTGRQRYKIEKYVREHHRKARKEAKKDPTWRSKVKKDPGIPNSFPYKDQLLAEIEERRKLKEEEKLHRRKEAQASRKEDKMELIDMEEGSMSALVSAARDRAAEIEGGENSDDNEMDEDGSEDEVLEDTEEIVVSSAIKKDNSRKTFDKEFQKVVSNADVILYVLDARDPEGTRSRETEKQIMMAEGGSKQVIFVLNKIDLVPGTVLKTWISHLSFSFPTIPVRAITSTGPNSYNHKSLTYQATSSALLRALKKYAQKKQLKRALTVGIIGLPNVGKSSVINSLVSRVGKGIVCQTGAEAGLTKSAKEIKLDSNLKLLDSPGIVFPGGTGKKNKIDEECRLVLQNAIPSHNLLDPVPAAKMVLDRMNEIPELFEKLQKAYDLPSLMGGTNATTDLLVHVARKRGRIGRGGVPDILSAAKVIINDWCAGRIVWWTLPPATDVQKDKKDTQIVSEWAAEFDLDGLLKNCADGPAVE
ncbi:GTPase grn1 [Neolecta irregularis DAH-3]|uniref:GTPase grn1 n=1 Tax=Neolecta irregularis (strain DAH-3) TaxID=1198029 RepID=A0A1U7LSC0_NEOID|nr:GTPase grn1 [Neolecta irregularis DAH-3]|eukprot:OLL25570.1 GTPase grn1 [Neolecta irregularis DAH-3]